MTITQLIEGLPADEQLAVRKLCKIRGETFEEFIRYASWKASQAIELGSEDTPALAVESRSRDGALESQLALVTLTQHRSGRVRLKVHGDHCDEITQVARRNGITPSAALREVVALAEQKFGRS